MVYKTFIEGVRAESFQIARAYADSNETDPVAFLDAHTKINDLSAKQSVKFITSPEYANLINKMKMFKEFLPTDDRRYFLIFALVTTIMILVFLLTIR